MSIRRLSARSTNTPASGPITRVGIATAISTPETASGAHVWPRASTAAIQTTRVVSKIWSPRYERPCAAHSRPMSRLMSGLDRCAATIAPIVRTPAEALSRRGRLDLGCGPGGDGQGEVHLRPLARLADEPDAAAVQANYLAGDRKTEPGAAHAVARGR